MSCSVVYVVHCIDTEGPLYESRTELFNCLNSVFSLDLEPSDEILRALKNQELDLGDDQLRSDIAHFVDPNIVTYLSDWRKIDEELDEILSDEFRYEIPDSFGDG